LEVLLAMMMAMMINPPLQKQALIKRKHLIQKKSSFRAKANNQLPKNTKYRKSNKLNLAMIHPKAT